MLLDDISSILDDVAVLTKVAAKNTAGVLGDDLALNAQQVTGVSASREIPVVWAVAKGSLVNKAILVPAALTLSVIAPWAIVPLLIIGGLYLCFEGCEKLAHKFLHSHEDETHEAALQAAVSDPNVDLMAIEREKIRGAIRTDFVLSAEIIVITLGTVGESPFMTKLIVLVAIAILMTIGVYGLVAGIVKLDDLGLWLARSGNGDGNESSHGTNSLSLKQRVGNWILAAAPVLLKLLSIVGTVAMFLVGGGILVHNVGPLHHALESVTDWCAEVDGIGAILSSLAAAVFNGLVGLLGGAVILLVVTGVKRIWPKSKPQTV